MAEPAETTKMAVQGLPVESPMEAQVQRLAQKVWKKYQGLDDSQRYLIAIAGIPGSGKTTLAASVGHAINKLYHEDRQKKHPNAPDYHATRQRHNSNELSPHGHQYSDSGNPDIAHVIPMDGYHLTRAQLSAMPNPDEAHYRRGAAFTFDADAYLGLVEGLRKPIEPTTRTIWAPSFDHAIKDPVKDDIPIPPTARIIIIEGLYTALCYPPPKTDSPSIDTKAEMPSAWAQACALMDEIWLVSVPMPTAIERVAKRNFKAGLSPTLEAAIERTVANDMRNGKEILDNLPPGDKLTERIESIDDERWKTQEQHVAADEVSKAEQEQEQQNEIQRFKMQRMGSIAEMAEAGAGL